MAQRAAAHPAPLADLQLPALVVAQTRTGIRHHRAGSTPRLHPADAPGAAVRRVAAPDADRLHQLQPQSGLRADLPAGRRGCGVHPARLPQPCPSRHHRSSRRRGIRRRRRLFPDRHREPRPFRSLLPQAALPRRTGNQRGELRRPRRTHHAGIGAGARDAARLAATGPCHGRNAFSRGTRPGLELHQTGHARAGLSASRRFAAAAAATTPRQRRIGEHRHRHRRFLRPA